MKSTQGSEEMRHARGFTLIELLVVIAIIGVLSSVVLASLNSARNKAVDAKKKQELREMITAVERYYIDTNTIPANPIPGSWVPADTALTSTLVPQYMPVIPTSPDNIPYYYYDYGTYFIVASILKDGSYGPGNRGWHCSVAAGGTTGSAYWCLEMDK
jgi:prepilin-type N-terminal cleavage/methylation domain-containing protein